MVTRAQVIKLEARIQALAEAQNPPITVAVFRGETSREAIARHLQLRPDHRGRPCKMEMRDHERTRAHELCAVHTIAELTRAIEAADGTPSGDNRGTDYVKHAQNKPNEVDTNL